MKPRPHFPPATRMSHFGFPCNWIRSGLVQHLSKREMIVLLVIMMKTFGYGKPDGDAISNSQLEEETVIDRSHCKRAAHGLEEIGLVCAHREMKDGAAETTFYHIVVEGEVCRKTTGGWGQKSPPVGPKEPHLKPNADAEIRKRGGADSAPTDHDHVVGPKKALLRLLKLYYKGEVMHPGFSWPDSKGPQVKAFFETLLQQHPVEEVRNVLLNTVKAHRARGVGDPLSYIQRALNTPQHTASPSSGTRPPALSPSPGASLRTQYDSHIDFYNAFRHEYDKLTIAQRHVFSTRQEEWLAARHLGPLILNEVLEIPENIPLYRQWLAEAMASKKGYPYD